MFQMSFGASRATRLLVAVGVVWLGLALSAQAAHATYSKIQIVKINQGGDANDVFTFDTGLTPSPSPAYFTLKGGQASSVFSVECNASSTCTSRWGSLTQTITERPATGYTLTGVVCRSTTGSDTWGAAPGPATPIDADTTFDPATRKITFKLDWWEQIKCEVTNTRDTGTIKVTKKVVAPAGDTGKFNLLVDAAAKASDIGDGGTTGAQSVTTGNHSVGETAGTGTSLADYAASTSCIDKAHPATPADTDGNVAVGKGDQWECVITNTRKTATIKVTKVLAPATDTGVFNLLVDGQAKATNVGNGGTTGVQTVLPGTHTVGESAGTASDLANYDSTTSCVDKAHAAKPADTDGSVQVAAGDQWECVITNTRKSSPPPPPPSDEPPTSQPQAEPVVSPQIAVSPSRVRPGSARLSGPSGCPTTSAVAATVSGRRIVKVTFYVDGRKVKTLSKANRNGQWVLPMNVKRFAFGTHRVRVTVQFATSSQTKTKTLRLSFSRGHPAVVTPKFTG
jgi:hypothetical protein